MKRLFVLSLATLFTLGISAQDNMEPFRHFSVGVEAGLHGVGIEVAMPVLPSLVVKAGYNWFPSSELINTDVSADTKDLKDAQEQYTTATSYQFQNKFGDEAVVSAGAQVGLSNFKLMLNWYPFKSSNFYLAGGLYYAPKDDDKPFLRISGNTTENDWAALQELRDKSGVDYDISLEIGNEKYAIMEKDGKGYLQADYKIDPLKYYVGFGFGRSIPNKLIGFQFELGTMIYHSTGFYFQEKEVDMGDAAEQFGDAAKTAVEYLDKFPIYPQIAFRFNFRAL
ncbi:MAG: hypothetical protein J6V95_08415 [Bacteroidaceae bacterium]|nr:hypothetical protein [Bacteroidaceae bacterium]